MPAWVTVQARFVPFGTSATAKAATKMPCWNEVVWPRFAGSVEKRLLLPTGTVTAAGFSFS